MKSLKAFQTDEFAEKLGLVGLFCFLFFAWLGTALAYTGLFLMLVTFIMGIPKNWQQLKHDPVIRLFMVFVVYLLFRTAWSVYEFPELTELHIHDGLEWLYLWLFIPVAWWLKQARQKIYLALLVFLLGFLLSVVWLNDWQACDVFVGSKRCGFGFQLILAALFLGTSLLGLLMYAPRLLGHKRFCWTWFLRLLTWLVIVLVVTYFLILTQTRTVWLGLALILPLLLLLRYRVALTDMLKGKRKTELVLGVLIIAIVSGVLLIKQSTFGDRVEQIKDDGLAIITLQFDKVDTSRGSLGLRLSMYQKGYDMWLQRPLFGWGVAGVNNEYFYTHVDHDLASMSHLHNTYSETLVRFGLVGGGILLALVGYVLVALKKSYRCHKIEKDHYYFLMASMALLAIWCFGDYQLFSLDWRIFCSAIFGIAYSFLIGQRQSSAS